MCVCFPSARLVCVCLLAILAEIVAYFSSGGVCVILRALLVFELGNVDCGGNCFQDGVARYKSSGMRLCVITRGLHAGMVAWQYYCDWS